MIDVTAHGARGDNATDNAAIINQLISGIVGNQADCVLYFPPGKYLFSGPVNIPRGLAITGPGMLQEGELGAVLVANYDEHDTEKGFLNVVTGVPFMGTGWRISGVNVFKGVGKHGGNAIRVAASTDPQLRPGRGILADSCIGSYGYNGPASWDRNLLIDGLGQTADGNMGVRDTYLSNVELTSADIVNAELRNAVHFFATNTQVYTANGKNAGILVTGKPGLNQQSQDVHLGNVSVWGTLTYDWTKLFTFRGYASALTVTKNAQHGVIMGVGGQWTNNGTSVIMTGA